MSQPAVKWGQAEKFFTNNGFEVRKPEDAVIVAPSTWGASRPTVRIGHKYCTRSGDELLVAHVSAIKRAFGVTRQQLIAGKKIP